MKLEVGMYVRTPYGIDKIKDIVLNGNLYEDSGLYLEKGIKLVCGKEEMKNLKASHNIIDLIEVGDYVNGYKVLRTNLNLKWYDDELGEQDETEGIELVGYGYVCPNSNYHFELKSIVTKEQFEAMAYKVG